MDIGVAYEGIAEASGECFAVGGRGGCQELFYQVGLLTFAQIAAG